MAQSSGSTSVHYRPTGVPQHTARERHHRHTHTQFTNGADNSGPPLPLRRNSADLYLLAPLIPIDPPFHQLPPGCGKDGAAPHLILFTNCSWVASTRLFHRAAHNVSSHHLVSLGNHLLNGKYCFLAARATGNALFDGIQSALPRKSSSSSPGWATRPGLPAPRRRRPMRMRSWNCREAGWSFTFTSTCPGTR